MSDILTAERVEDTYAACLLEPPEDWSDDEVRNDPDVVIVEGIVSSTAFAKSKLAKHREDIIAMLDELPDGFKRGSGGGWSFLQACVDRHEHQWTGLHRTMGHLFDMGVALGVVHLLLEERALWEALPGGMPYYIIDSEA